MADSTKGQKESAWLWWFPPARWLPEYRSSWLVGDIVAGVTLAAYAIPVSLAYAGLAGLPPQVGIYGYLLGGLGYALLGSSRQLAIGPTSAISLMIAGTVGAMAEGDAQRYAEIASLVAFTVAAKTTSRKAQLLRPPAATIAPVTSPEAFERPAIQMATAAAIPTARLIQAQDFNIPIARSSMVHLRSSL
jgi:hypothetical protein